MKNIKGISQLLAYNTSLKFSQGLWKTLYIKKFKIVFYIK